MKAACLIACLVCSLTFSQTLEERIYDATEIFIAQGNQGAYHNLEKQELEFKKNTTTKEEQLALVFLLCNKAFYLNGNNRLKLAISTYEEAWERYNDHGLSTVSDYDMIEYCLKPLGNLYTKTNDFTNAENTIQQYIGLAQKIRNKEHYVAGLINLSVLYQTRGMHASVLELIAQSEKVSGIGPSQQEKLNNLKSFSTIALKATSDKDFTINTGFSNTDNAFLQQRLAYQAALLNKDYVKALQHYKQSQTLQDKNKLTVRELAKYKVEEAQLYYVLNNFEKADALLENALALLVPGHKAHTVPEHSSLYAENTLIDIFDLKSRLQTDTDNALAYYDLSFYVAGLLNANLTSQESKLANLIGNRKRSEWCIALLYDGFKENPSPETFIKALNYAENDKAAVLHEAYQKKSLVSRYPNDSLLRHEQGLLKKQERLTEVLVRSQLGYGVHQEANLNKELLDVSIALKSVAQAIDLKYGALDNDAMDLQELYKKLEQDNAALQVYFFGNDAIYQFQMASGQFNFFKIVLTAEVTKSIVSFIHLFDNASIINNDIKAFSLLAHKVYKLLNLDMEQSQSNLVIIPDGLLNFVPFEALLTEPTETTTFSGMPFFVTSHSIAYNSNIRFYLEDQKKITNPKILGLFPVFENSNQPLDHSIEEAHALKKISKAKLLMYDAANKEEFLNRAADYDILHLSTHATGGDFTNPATITFIDQSLLVNELYGMAINPELVVLSACETGIGKLSKGEGAMSIARGFQYAGAKNILYTLWPINDASTARLMELFYKAYAKTNSANYANRQSKLDYLRNSSISNLKKSPYYWSAFTYYGKIDKAEHQKIPFYYFIGALPLIIGLFLWLGKRKNK